MRRSSTVKMLKEAEGQQRGYSSDSHFIGSMKYHPNTGIYHKTIKYPEIESEKSLHTQSNPKQSEQPWRCHKTLSQIKLQSRSNKIARYWYKTQQTNRMQ